MSALKGRSGTVSDKTMASPPTDRRLSNAVCSLLWVDHPSSRSMRRSRDAPLTVPGQPSPRTWYAAKCALISGLLLVVDRTSLAISANRAWDWRHLGFLGDWGRDVALCAQWIADLQRQRDAARVHGRPRR